MVQQKKIFNVQNLAQKIKDSKAVYLTDYRGLGVGQLTQLRKAVKDAGGQLEVAKNRLFKLALKDSGKKIDADEIELTGPTAILWANEDEISPLKALVKFAQENQLPTIKIGLFGHDLLSPDQVSQLAQIPSLQNLQAKLVGSLNSPIYGLAHALNWNLQKLTLTIKAIADQKA